MEQISDVTYLLKRVKELEEEVGLLKHDLVIQQNINFEWSGNLGKWNWNIKEDIVEFNNKKVEALGYNRSELPEKIGYSFFTDKIHPEDYKGVMQNMISHLSGETPAYEVEYRIRHKNGNWIWFYDRGVIYSYDRDGKPNE